MGKSKKKDDDKKAALQARKEAKLDKAAQKRLKKEQGSLEGDDENLDDLLDQYRKRDVEVNTTVLETLPGFPPPRGNASLTHVEDKNGYLYVLGGEYYDGIENIVIDDLLRWDPTKQEWKQILSPNPRPAPRCAHSCVAYNKALYVFGGELASADQYHHYRDLWKFDTSTLKWEEIITRNTGSIPSARSGHTAFVWKNYMIIFGGFYEALKDTRWFNDVCILDLQTHTWLDIPHSKLAARPEPRSACNVGILNDSAIFQGGYSKLKNPTTKGEAKVHNDAWILHLKPILQGKPPTWERLSLRAKGPQNRAGTVSTTYKGRMLVFGGVVDEEQAHHKVASVFYNDLFAFDMERRKWFPIRSKPVQVEGVAKRGRRRRKTESIDEDVEEEEATAATESDDDLELEADEEEIDQNPSNGWDLDMLRSNMFAFIDGEGNIVYEKIDKEDEKKGTEEGEDNDDDEEEEEKEDDGGYDEVEGQEEKEEDDVEYAPEEQENENQEDMARTSSTTFALTPDSLPSKTVSNSQVMFLNEKTGAPEAVARVEPLPRMNAKMLVRSNILYIFGGILEVGDREVTLDDCWIMDLRKRTHWECLWEGTMHKQVWRGAIHDDDDSYISAGTGANDDSDDDDDSADDDEDEIDVDALKAAKKVKSVSKKAKAKMGLKHEIAELNAELKVGDENRTPALGESMSEFYSRTSDFWTQKAASSIQKRSVPGEPMSNKAMKREGFLMAQSRFDELRPVIDRLNELELQQEEVEGEVVKAKGERKVKDKKKKRVKD